MTHAHPSHLPPLRALFFDACGVLYHRPGGLPGLARLLAAHGLPPVNPDEARGRCRSVRARAFAGRASPQEYVQATLTAYGLTRPALRREGARLLSEGAADIALFEGVAATLPRLKGLGFKLGVITDTAHSTADKLAWLARAGLSLEWDAFVASCEVGVCKPHPRIYRMALEQAGVRAGEAAFVGHSAAELEGATAAGLTTIAFNWDDGAAADFYLPDFQTLLMLPAPGSGSGKPVEGAS
jgi:putative hydrolase of the HAD superfamily